MTTNLNSGVHTLEYRYTPIDQAVANLNGSDFFFHKGLAQEIVRPISANDTEQSNLILKYAYKESTPEGVLGAQTYEFNNLGKDLAGKDGKISVNELKALDTNNDNKVSQEEFRAKKAEVEGKKTDKPINSMNEMMNLFMKLMQMMMGFGGGFYQPQPQPYSPTPNPGIIAM